MNVTNHSALLEVAPPAGWRVVPLWALFTRRKLLGHTDEPMLSVFREHGVVRKDSLPNLNKTAEDRSIYQLVDDGWLVVNRMKAFQGSVGVSFERGIVSGHYICFRPRHSESSRFLNWLLRSDVYRTIFHRLSRGVRPGQIEIDNDYLHSVPVLLPPLDVQRRIADFLDDQVGSMDRALELRRREVDLVETRRRAALTEIVFSDSVRIVPLGAVASVQLGRQRSPEHENGEFQMPYLRSANVTDGQILIQDVKSMNFEPAERRTFLLRVGDVLVTEGAGSPESVGASAVYRDEWHGAVCFQNTLVRLRPRGGVEAEYLGWWARAAHAAGAMRSYATGANILHIGVESLKRMPFPLRDERGQGRVMDRCDSLDAGSQALHRALQASCDLLAERKRALITAAVTGEFDVATASFRATDSAIIGVGGAE